MRALGVLLLLAVIAVGVMYYQGWLIFQPRPDSTAIEVKTGEMKREAQQAAEKGRQIWRDTEEKLQPKREPVDAVPSPSPAP